MTREYTPEMGEISGFGGGYEAICRKMVLAGVNWLEANPTADPKFLGHRGVYGLLLEDNEDAKALSKAMTAVEVTGGDCTGAMHHATVSHVLFIKTHGWDKYVEEMTKPEEKE